MNCSQRRSSLRPLKERYPTPAGRSRVYAKGLMVVALCAAFVLAFALVLNCEAAGIGIRATTLATSQTTCSASDASCESLTITSATLHTVNYTDDLWGL
jgi:hypothetical protein